jgi:hypothetical protein
MDHDAEYFERHPEVVAYRREVMPGEFQDLGPRPGAPVVVLKLGDGLRIRWAEAYPGAWQSTIYHTIRDSGSTILLEVRDE